MRRFPIVRNVLLTRPTHALSYYGSKYTFLRWLGVSTANYGNLFYSDANVINAFRQYVTQMINRRNPYNGLRYGDDPTIVMWETGQCSGWLYWRGLWT